MIRMEQTWRTITLRVLTLTVAAIILRGQLWLSEIEAGNTLHSIPF